jgi:DNA polymerase III epsilon subunit-like protein
MKILAFDTETTGLDCKTNDVVEFGCCLYDENQNKLHDYSKLFKTKMRMSQEVINIHGITHDMLTADGAWFKDEYENILEIFNSADIYVGHNVTFDIDFMKEMFLKVGAQMPEKPFIDTISVAYRYVPSKESKRSLTALCKWAKIPLENAHRALDDAEASINLMFALSKIIDISIEELVDKDKSPALGCLHWGQDPFLSQFVGNRIAYEAFND